MVAVNVQKDNMRTDSDAAGAEWSDALSEKLTPYQRPDRRRAICHVFTSALPLAACRLLMAYSLRHGYWLTCLLAVPAAGFQHQFDNAYWRPREQWNFREASLQGSSYFELPRVLHWFTANIGFHHVHHLNPRIPIYNLAACHRDIPELHQSPRITLSQSWRLAALKLWDEERQRLVGFPAQQQSEAGQHA